MEKDRSAFNILIGKRPLGSPKCSWEDTIRINLKEISISRKNWVDSAQDRNYWRALMNAILIVLVHEPWSYYYFIWVCLLHFLLHSFIDDDNADDCDEVLDT